MKLHLATLSVAGLMLLGGCTFHGDVVGPEPAGYAVVETPGYYYDDAYVDVYGHYHPRVYYYYNGHQWAHRDRIPHGVVIHARVEGHGHADHRDVHRNDHQRDRHDHDDH